MADDEEVGPGTLHELPQSMREEEGTLAQVERLRGVLARTEEAYSDAIKQRNTAVAALEEFKFEVDGMREDIARTKTNAELLRQESSQVQNDLAKVADELGSVMDMLRAIERVTVPGIQGIEGACRALAVDAIGHAQKAIASVNDARDVDIPF